MIEFLFLAAMLSAVDGDTIDLDGERIRVLGVDTPEINCHCQRECGMARAAKAFTAERLRGQVGIERHGKDRYGRTLARVTVDGIDLAVLLVDAGLGRPYGGGKRKSWCGG